MLCGCGGDSLSDEEEHDIVPITFVSQIENQEEIATRSTAEPLAQSFVMYGFKHTTNELLVFDGYNLTYANGSEGTSAENTHGYSYINGTNIKGITQEIKFWDFAADWYRFWGYVPNVHNNYAPSTHTLSFTNIDAETLATCLCSKTKTVEKAEYGQVVQLQFIHPATLVQVRFYCGEQLEAGDEINLTDISFVPNDLSNNPIVTKGTVEVQYNPALSSETYTTEASSDDGSILTSLSYNTITLTSANCTSSTSAIAKQGDKEIVVLFPHSSAAVPTSFTMNVNIDGDAKTAVVPTSYMHWLPNHRYTYIFKITEAGKKIEFYDVKVDPWKYGGSQADEWKNW